MVKVAAKSKPQAVAGAIMGEFKEKGYVEVHAIGAGAVNQAVKAIAIARGFAAPAGYDLIAIPAFGEAAVESDESRTMIRFIVRAEKK